jgi:iron complex outermembrane receptor protein
MNWATGSFLKAIGLGLVSSIALMAGDRGPAFAQQQSNLPAIYVREPHRATHRSVRPRRAATKPAAAPLVAQHHSIQQFPSINFNTSPASAPYGQMNPDGSSVASGGFYVETPTFGPFGNVRDKDIPFSTTTITKQIIDDQQVHSANDALKNDSSFNSFPMTAGYAQNYYIRGFQVGPQNGVYQDGLDLLGYVNPFVETNQRIDIARGAVSVLYGFAAPAGLVNFISKMPLDVPLTQVDLGYISRGSFYGAADVSRRFGEGNQFGIRLNAYQQDGNTPIHHTDANRGAQSISLDWKPLYSDVKIWAKVEHSNVDVNGNNSTFFLQTSPYIPLPKAPDPSKLYGQPWFHDYNTNFLSEAGAEYKSNGWTVTGAVGYSSTTRKFLNNFDNPALQTDGTYGLRYVYGQLHDENSAYRAMVSKEVNAVFDHTISFVANGSNHEYKIDQVVSPLYGLSNIWNPVYFPKPNLVSSPPVLKQDMAFNTQILQDKIDLTKYLTFYVGGVHSAIDAQAWSLPSNTQTSDIHQEAFTPVAALLFKPWEHLTFYASYIEALQPGAQAPSTAVNAYQMLSPFIGKQYELGVKAELLPGLETNIALFRIDQAYAFLNDSNVFTASGTQENQGIELSATGRITSDLLLRSSLTAMAAKIHGGTQDGQDAAGVSSLRANLFAEYTLPMLPQLTLMGGIFYQNSFVVGYNTAANVALGFQPIVYAPGFATFDLGAKYNTELFTKPVAFRLYATNLFNHAYWQSTTGGANVQVGQPLTVKLSASVLF